MPPIKQFPIANILITFHLSTPPKLGIHDKVHVNDGHFLRVHLGSAYSVKTENFFLKLL